MRKINLTLKRLRFQRVNLKRFANFRFKLRGGSFFKAKKKLFKRFILRRRILLKLSQSRSYRLVVKLKGTRFYKLLIKNTQFIRKFYGDMRQNELKKWANFFRSKQKLKKKWGLTNLILKLDNRLNSYLVHNGLINSVSQLKQYILHGKVLVNNKIIRGYNFQLNWLDQVSLKSDLNISFNLSKIWQRFFFFKYLRLRSKSRALLNYYIQFNLLNETYYNSEQLWFLNRINTLSQYFLLYKSNLKKRLRIRRRRNFQLSNNQYIPINWKRRQLRFKIRKKILSFHFFTKNKDLNIRKLKKGKYNYIYPFFLLIRWFLLIQKYKFYLK